MALPPTRPVPPARAPIAGDYIANEAWLDFFAALGLAGVTAAELAVVKAVSDAAKIEADASAATLAAMGTYLSVNVSSVSPVSLASSVATDVAALSLPAGDWDVWGTIVFAPNATTTVDWKSGWINTAAATVPTDNESGSGGFFLVQSTVPAGRLERWPIGRKRLLLASPGTAYLTAQSNYAVSTMGAYGFLAARRVK